MAVFRAGEYERRVAGMGGESPHRRVGSRVQHRRRPVLAAIAGAVDAGARAGSAVAHRQEQSLAGEIQRIHRARVVQAVEPLLGRLAVEAARIVEALANRVDGYHDLAGGLAGCRRQQGNAVDIGAVDTAFGRVDALPAIAAVGTAPCASFLYAEPDFFGLVGMRADGQDARTMHAAAEFRQFGAESFPTQAAVARAVHAGAGRSAGAREDQARIARAEGDRPDRMAIGGRFDAAEVRAAVGAQANAHIGPRQHARRIGGVYRQAAYRAVEFDGFLQAQPVPAGAIVIAAQDALARRAHQNCSLHIGLLLMLLPFKKSPRMPRP